MNEINKEKNNNDFKSVDQLIGKIDPEILLELNESKYQSAVSIKNKFLSGPVMLLLLIGIFDFIVAFILDAITNQQHILIWGSLGIVLVLPWPLLFLDGIAILVYGIYVMKNKRGDLDMMSSSSGPNEIQNIAGPGTEVLGVIYLVVGTILIGSVIVRMLIQN